MKKALALLCAILMFIPVFAGCQPSFGGQRPTETCQPSELELTYNEGLALLDQGDYTAAQEKLLECIGYKDADKLLACFIVRQDSQTQRSTYNHDGISNSSEVRIEYTYDQYGNPILENRFYEGELSQWIEYQYDSYGNNTHYFVYNGDGSLYSSQILEYNEHGHMIHLTYYISSYDHTQIHTYTYEYDADGRVLSLKTFGENGNLEQEVHWQYDDYGNVTFYSRSDSSGDLKQRDTYKFIYDENGRITHEECYIINGSLHSTRDIVYDLNGNILSEIAYYGDGSLMKNVAYTYDERGFVTSETQYDSDHNITMHKEYEYEGATLYFNPYLKSNGSTEP